MSYTEAQAELLRLVGNRAAPRPGDRTLPARRLVEFRCSRAGHLLGVIYASRLGPLFVSTSDELTDDAAGRRQSVADGKALVDRFGDGRLKQLAWEPSPRLPLVDDSANEIPAPTSCRCGTGPALTRGALRWSLENLSDETAVFGVSQGGISGARNTLFYKF